MWNSCRIVIAWYSVRAQSRATHCTWLGNLVRGSSAVEQWTVESNLTMQCAWKTCVREVSAGRRFCDTRCKSKFFVDKRRKKLKQLAIQYKGGKCSKCGYASCEAALAFHHLEPEHKDFAVGEQGFTRSWERIRSEIDKCALLCLNCHAEIHQAAHGGNTMVKNWVNSVNAYPANAEPSLHSNV